MKLLKTLTGGLIAAAFCMTSAVAATVITATIVGNGASAPFALENFGSGGAARKVSSNDFLGVDHTTSTGVKVSFTGNSGIYSGDLGGQTRSPFRTVTGVATEAHYLNARKGGSVVMDFGTTLTDFNLLWWLLTPWVGKISLMNQ
jgi:hypothetical protein